jgi:hypothetical protein
VVYAVVAWPHELGDAEVLALDPEAARGIHAVVHHAAAVSRLHRNSVVAAGAHGRSHQQGNVNVPSNSVTHHSHVFREKQRLGMMQMQRQHRVFHACCVFTAH